MLTREEKRFFYGFANRIKSLFGVKVDIVPLDHKAHIPMEPEEEILGCCHKMLDDDGNIAAYLISIDEPYIKACYHGARYSPYNRDTLAETICHEIAHLYIWEHGPEHSELTKELHNAARRAY